MYLTYLSVLTAFAVQYNTTYNNSTYYFTQIIQDNFDVSEVTNDNSFWEYVNGPFIESIYGTRKGDGFTPPSQQNIHHSYYRISGPIRFRQLRSQTTTCIDYQPPREWTDGSFIAEGPYECIPPFTSEWEDKSNFGPNKQYYWESSDVLQSPSLVGLQGQIYPGDGFAVYVSPNATEGVEQINEIQANYWTDMQTRFIAIEFLVANDNLNLLSSVYLLFEFLATGSTLSTTKVLTIPRTFFEVKEDTGQDEWVRPVFALQVMLAIYAFGFLFHELQQMFTQRLDYLKDAWNAFDITLFTLLFAILGLQLRMYGLEPVAERFVDTDSPGFITFQETVNSSYLQKELLAILLFMSWARVLFFLGIHPSFGPMQLIVKNMSVNMVQFLLLLSIFLIAFSTAFYTVYGSVLPEYSSIRLSTYSLGNALFGNFEFEPLNDNDMFLGPILLFGFLLVCSVLLMNFLIAILSGTYEDIQAKSEEKYREIFAETVISLLQAPWPAPLNMLRPVLFIIRPAWGLVRPILRFIDHFSWWAWEDRMRAWYFLWEDVELDEKITDTLALPDLYAFSDYANLFKDFWITAWVDYLVIIISWIFTAIFGIFLLAIKLVIWMYGKIVPHRVRHEINKELEFLEEFTVGKKKSANEDQYRETHKTFYRSMIRLFWIVTYFIWYPLYFLRYIWMLKEIEEARHRAKGLGGFDFDQSSRGCDDGSDVDVSFSKDSMIVSNRSHGTACIYGKNRWDKKKEDIWYFEVEIISPGWVSIGVMLDNAYKSYMPGKAPHSIGFDSRSGEILTQLGKVHDTNDSSSESMASTPTLSAPRKKEGVIATYPVWCNVGDVAGCGIEFNGRLVFFTHQGRLLHHTIKVDVDEVYPAVGLYGFGNTVRINFGSHQFRLTAPEALISLISNEFERSALPRISVTSDSTVICYTDPVASTSTVMATQPWTDDILSRTYFEIEVINSGSTGEFYIGCGRNDFNRQHSPGVDPQSIGYRVQITRLVGETTEPTQSSSGKQHVFIVKTANNEDPVIFGCGMNYKSRSLFLTLQGSRLDISDAKWLESGDIPALHAGITLTSYGQCIRGCFDRSAPSTDDSRLEEFIAPPPTDRVHFDTDRGAGIAQIAAAFGRAPSPPSSLPPTSPLSALGPSDSLTSAHSRSHLLQRQGSSSSSNTNTQSQSFSLLPIEPRVVNSCTYQIVVEESVFKPEAPRVSKKDGPRRPSSSAAQKVAHFASYLNIGERGESAASLDVASDNMENGASQIGRKDSRLNSVWSALTRPAVTPEGSGNPRATREYEMMHLQNESHENRPSRSGTVMSVPEEIDL